MHLNTDDAMRADVIERLMCDFELDIPGWERRWGRAFRTEYAGELERLVALVNMGLLAIEPAALRITETGRLLVRHVCQVFDVYLSNPALRKAQYSRNH
jgi:oxygen-independent coproporphyrinogen-3 oxidase